MTKVDFSLILACYNEGPTFTKSLDKIFDVLKGLKINWEVVFVEDKSTDNTREVLNKYVGGRKNCTIVLHAKNQGRGRAVADGILKSRGKICGFMDVDCEISPTYLPVFISEIKDGSEMAIATRYYDVHLRSIVRVLASRVYSLLMRLVLNLPFKDTEAGFKFFKRDAALSLINRAHDHGWFWDTEICAIADHDRMKITQVPVLFVKMSNKKSTVHVVSDSWDYALKLWQFRKKYKNL
ncbi:glycosyltransferase [Candidatus Curtissbacteria bacterium]|nr:glycosyltransferase [Candidatus Curtissbacteria bacterium]